MGCVTYTSNLVHSCLGHSCPSNHLAGWERVPLLTGCSDFTPREPAVMSMEQGPDICIFKAHKELT